MKHNYLKHLFTALLLLCTTVVTAHDIEVGGIYYNILSETDKTVEVTFKGTSYYDSRGYSGSVVIPETVVVSGTKTFDAWTSTNKSNSTTSQTSYTFYVEAGNILKFDWLVSSESNYDWLIITLDGTEIVKKSGTLSGSYEKTFDTAGSHTLVVKYTKDSSQSSGNDEGKICNITLSGVGSVNDIVYRVTSIGEYAFYDCSGLTSVVIPSSVTSIEESAFSGCTGLTSITIPDSVTSIGNYAFSWCSGLTSIKIPNSVTSIGESAFNECIGLKKVHTSDLSAWYGIDFGKNYANPLYYAKNLYLNGELVTELVIPDGVKEIKNYTFYGCSGLTSVVIPNSVTSIGNSAFRSCTGLTSITIPNSVTSIGNSAFHSCSGLTSVTIGNSVTSIGGAAFYYCTGLTSVTIPNSVTSIGNSAFCNCTRLTSITIPNSVTSIGGWAFKDCTGLTSITIPNSITSIGEEAFYRCTGLTSIIIPNSVTSIGGNAFRSCSGLTSVTIGNSVTSIGSYAFEGCTGLTSITIPNSVTSIGGNAFCSCSGLTSVTSLIPADELFAIYPNVFDIVDKTTCTLYVPYGAKETYASTAGWSEFVNIVELDLTDLTITINQYGCATYCSPYALDFSEVEGLKAYSAIGYKPSTQVVTLARVMTTGAGQGVFVKGEPGEYTVPVIDNFDEYTLNMLVGTLEQTVVNSTEGEMSNYKFTVAELDEAPMFYPFEDNTTFSAGKAYLQIPTAWLPSTAQKSLSIRFDDSETTDIDELEGENGEVETIYDLQGRVVENPTSGIYIINGKKVVVK